MLKSEISDIISSLTWKIFIKFLVCIRSNNLNYIFYIFIKCVVINIVFKII